MRYVTKHKKTKKISKICKEVNDLLLCLKQKITENNASLEDNMHNLNYKTSIHCDNLNSIANTDVSQIRNYSEEITKFMHKIQKCFNNIKNEINSLVLNAPNLNNIKINLCNNNNDCNVFALPHIPQTSLNDNSIDNLSTHNNHSNECDSHSFSSIMNPDTPKLLSQIVTENNQQITNNDKHKNNNDCENANNSRLSLRLNSLSDIELREYPSPDRNKMEMLIYFCFFLFVCICSCVWCLSNVLCDALCVFPKKTKTNTKKPQT